MSRNVNRTRFFKSGSPAAKADGPSQRLTPKGGEAPAHSEDQWKARMEDGMRDRWSSELADGLRVQPPAPPPPPHAAFRGRCLLRWNSLLARPLPRRAIYLQLQGGPASRRRRASWRGNHSSDERTRLALQTANLVTGAGRSTACRPRGGPTKSEAGEASPPVRGAGLARPRPAQPGCHPGEAGNRRRARNAS